MLVLMVIVWADDETVVPKHVIKKFRLNECQQLTCVGGYNTLHGNHEIAIFSVWPLSTEWLIFTELIMNVMTPGGGAITT
jgi:hypothetical protein